MPTTLYTQSNRKVTLSTPLGPDVLLLQNFIHKEELGRPFELTLEMQSTNQEIDFSKILGQSVTVSIQLPIQETRYLNGIVSEFTQTVFESPEGLYSYRAVVVPWISMLDLTTDCRCFQNQTIPEILEAVFKTYNFYDYELNLTQEYVAREFCVQYRETAFNFVHRLMEFAGITYFYKHEDGKHTIVLCDTNNGYLPFHSIHEVPYKPGLKDPWTIAITEWWLNEKLCPGTVELNDYDYAAPQSSLLGNASGQQPHPHGAYQHFDYPGCYQTQDSPETYAAIRLSELQCRRLRVRGRGPFAGINVGYSFQFMIFPRKDQNQGYVPISTKITITTPPYSTTGSFSDDGVVVDTEFEVIPSTIRYCNPRITPKPRIHGVQTAVVAGPEGQDTPYVSGYGSVVLQFRWDRYGQNNQNSSIWIRVSQLSAGKGWGSMFIPYIGNEVVVAFEEGDPDRPMIVGRLYNALQMPKLPLPKNNQKSYICDSGGDIICFYPLSGSESIKLYSPYNQTSKVVGATPGKLNF